MNKKLLQQNGFTLPEMMVSLGIFVILFAFVASTYVTMQKLFPSGINQAYVQSYARTGLNLIADNVRSAISASIGGSGSSLTLVIDPNNTYNDPTDDVTISYTVSGTNLIYDPDTTVNSNEQTLIQNVKQVTGIPYFQQNQNSIIITYKVSKEENAVGEQNVSLSTTVFMRNVS